MDGLRQWIMLPTFYANTRGPHLFSILFYPQHTKSSLNTFYREVTLKVFFPGPVIFKQMTAHGLNSFSFSSPSIQGYF